MEDTPQPAARRDVPDRTAVPAQRSAPEVPPSVLTVVEQVAEFVNEVRSRLTGPGEAFAGPEDWADFLTRKARMFAVVAASPYAPPSASEVAEEAAAEAAEAWREAEEARREAGRAGSGRAGSGRAGSGRAGSAGDRRVGT